MKAEVTEIKSLSGGRGSGQKVRQKNPACVFWQRKRTNSSKTPLTLEPIQITLRYTLAKFKNTPHTQNSQNAVIFYVSS